MFVVVERLQGDPPAANARSDFTLALNSNTGGGGGVQTQVRNQLRIWFQPRMKVPQILFE